MLRLLLLLGAAAATSKYEPRCPNQWVPRSGSPWCYRFFDKIKYSWNEAASYCKARGGVLVTIEEKPEKIFIGEQAKSEFYHIGLSSHKIGEWRWEDGSLLTSNIINWNNGQPSRTNKIPDCAMIDTKTSAMSDTVCDTNEANFICKRNINTPIFCPTGWEQIGKRCYRMIPNSRHTFDFSDSYMCSRYGGRMVTVQNAQEAQFIFEALEVSKQSKTWVGLKDSGFENWMWITATANSSGGVDPTPYWGAGEPAYPPTRPNSTYCAQAWISDQKWHLGSCYNYLPYICERAASGCAYNWAQYKSKCVQINTDYASYVPWTSAHDICIAQNASLLHIQDNAENTWVGQSTSQYYWLDMSDDCTGSDRHDNQYKWCDDNTNVWDGYNNFYRNKTTDTANKDDCTFIDGYASDAHWHNTPCVNNHYFACQSPVGSPVTPASVKFEDYYCPSGWTKLGSRCYWFINDPVTWMTAVSNCAINNSVVTDLTHADEQSFVNGYMATSYWSGLNDRVHEGTYVWKGLKTDSPLNTNKYRNWGPNEPAGGEGNCVSVKVQTDQFGNHYGSWQDSLCSVTMAYVCEKDAWNSKTRPTRTPNTTPWPTQCGPYWDYEQVSGFCYRASEERNSWVDAIQACQEYGGDLASLHSVAEMSALSLYTSKFFGGHLSVWIGASDRDTEGGWSWSDNSAFNYLNWNVGEPNDYGAGEDCAEMYSDTGNWNDQSCGNRNQYVCKKYGGAATTITPSTTLPTKHPGDYWGCPSGWSAYGNNCWRQFDTRLNRHDALVACRKTGGDLAAIHSADENQFVLSITNHVCTYFKDKGYNNAGGVTIISEIADYSKCETDCDAYQGKCIGYTYDNTLKKCYLKSLMANRVADPNFDSYSRGCVNHAWLGLSDMATESSFVWTDQTSVDYTAWGPGEPNNYANREDCVELYAESGGWNDIDCAELRPSICKQPKSVQPSPSGPPTQSGCPNGAISWQNGCYLFMDSDLKSANAAQVYCKTSLAGGHLIGIDDRYEQAFLTSQLGSRSSAYFIGLQYTQGTYKWTDNNPVSYSNWDMNYPDASLGQCVVATAGKVAGFWTNADCTKGRPYICESPRSGHTQPVITTSTADPSSVCPSGWAKVAGGGKCYKAFSAGAGLTWAEARASCKSLTGNLLGGKGELAAIPDSATNDLITKTVTKGPQDQNAYWIGLNSLGKGTESWSDGSALNYVKWGSGQPNHGTQGEYHCVNLIPSNGGSWYESNCATVNAWICEVPVGTNLQTTTMGPSPTPSIHCPGSPRSGGLPWLYFNQTCYWISGSSWADLMSWQDAETFCKQHQSGAELLSIHTQDEMNFILTSMQKSGYSWNSWWIGLSQLTSDDASFAWSDGTFVDFQYWNAGEPNNYGVTGESCTETYRSGKWNDNHCTVKTPFICKYDTNRKPFTTPNPVSGNCPTGWLKTSAMCYKYFDLPRNYTAARDYCKALTGRRTDLASIPDHHVQVALVAGMADFSSHGQSYWIGLSDADREMQFRWTDNSQYGYANWNAGEPNGNWWHDEDCAEMYTGVLNAGRWNDLACNVNRGFVCEQLPDTKLPTPTPPSGCSTNYTKSGPNCYRMLKAADTWAAQEALCNADGSGFSHLAFVENVYEDAFLRDWLTQLDQTDLYIGMNDQDKTHVYQWSSGWPVLYSNWAPGEPTALDGQGCVTVNNDGQFHDRNCSLKFAAVCQYSTKTPPTVRPNSYCQRYKSCPITTGGIQWTDAGGCYCYYANVGTYSNQVNAHKECLELDADLLSINSWDENEFIRTVMSPIVGGRSIWLGLLQSKITGGFKWTDGSALRYTNWSPGEPNNYNSQEDCAEIYTGNGLWNDISCETSLATICKVPKIPTPTPTWGPQGYCNNNRRWLLYNGNCYYIATGFYGLDYMTAQARCNTLDSGSTLASVHSQDEADWLLGAIKHSSYYVYNNYWLGLSELDEAGIYKWQDMTPVDYVNWADGEPNDYGGGESCVELYPGAKGQWNDQHCGEKNLYICKKANGTTAPPATMTPHAGNCPYGWITFPDSPKCYKAFNNPLNWTDAEAACRLQGSTRHPGHLLSIHSGEEQAFLIALMPSYKFSAWIGLTDSKSERRFLWRDETSYNYANWAAGEPNGKYWGSGQEDCVEMYWTQNNAGQWNDLACSAKRGYMCTIRKDPNLPSPPPPSSKNCTTGFYDPYQKACYTFAPKADTWANSEAACVAKGAHLISVQNVYEEALLTTIMLWNNNKEGIWTGLKRTGASFGWSDNWPVYYMDWDDTQPTEGPNDKCVVAKAKSIGKWTDTTCSSPYYSVCKHSLVPPPVQPTMYPGICPSLSLAKYKYLDAGTATCFLFVTDVTKSFADAHMDCLTKKGNLASIHMLDDNNFLTQVFTQSAVSNNLWLGFLRMDGGSFGWVDGTPADFSAWASGEPNDYNQQEDCGEMKINTITGKGEWNDISCATKNGYICATRKIPMNETTPGPVVTTVFPWKPHTRGPHEMATPSYGLPSEGVAGMVLLAVVAIIVVAVLFMFIQSKRAQPSPPPPAGGGISVASTSVEDAGFENPNTE